MARAWAKSRYPDLQRVEKSTEELVCTPAAVRGPGSAFCLACLRCLRGGCRGRPRDVSGGGGAEGRVAPLPLLSSRRGMDRWYPGGSVRAGLGFLSRVPALHFENLGAGCAALFPALRPDDVTGSESDRVYHDAV